MFALSSSLLAMRVSLATGVVLFTPSCSGAWRAEDLVGVYAGRAAQDPAIKTDEVTLVWLHEGGLASFENLPREFMQVDRSSGDSVPGVPLFDAKGSWLLVSDTEIEVAVLEADGRIPLVRQPYHLQGSRGSPRLAYYIGEPDTYALLFLERVP